MLIDNQLIKDRPKDLLEIDFYTQLPEVPVEFAYDSLPEFLNVDLLQMFGIIPKTMDLIMNTQRGFLDKPSEKEIDYYRKRDTKFQMINVVANIHTFKISGDKALAFPYSISLVAGSKRGEPQTCSIDFFKSVGFNQFESNNCYSDFSPFLPVQQGFYGPIELFYGNNDIQVYTDTIGFVLETFFLPTDIDLDDAVLHEPQGFDREIITRYGKYRKKKRYFKPFTNVVPRRIWGCDSPIELFLIQALAKRGHFPVIQTLIFKNGEIHDNFYDMISKGIFIKGDELITDVDLFFPDKKNAVFCDSTKFHRGEKAKTKDERISNQLSDLGIRSIRVSGKDIVERLDIIVEEIITQLKID
jgi:hypothetical protein